MFEFRKTDHEDLTILYLQGHLNALTAEQLRGVINDMVMTQRRFVVLDLSSLELIDSSGVGALVSLFKRIRGFQGQVKIAGLRGQPREIFQLLNLHKAFDIASDVEEATRELLGKMKGGPHDLGRLRRLGVLSK
ncbi:MAG: anti-sigma factor antagonist [Deltaproteobacteria bacterium]|nr:MAG: anti-sigma factor antagonist [Deltaproteobacteria bacterium]